MAIIVFNYTLSGVILILSLIFAPIGYKTRLNQSLRMLAHTEGFTLSAVGLFFVYRQRQADCSCALLFAFAVDVAVYVRRSSHIAVTHPILNHLHRYAVCKEQRCATVSEVMKSN